MAEHSHAMVGPALLMGSGSKGGEALRAHEATAAVLRLTQNRSFFGALLAASLALHLCALAAILWLEHAPPLKPDLTQEIPVDLVSAPPAPAPASGAKGDKDASKAPSSVPVKSSTPAPAPKPPPPVAPKPPARAPAPKPPEPARPMPAQAAPKPPQPLQPPPQLAQPLSPPVAPEGTPEGKPQGLMRDDSRAVAVPSPTDDGDDVISYQTLVFGMLELKKQFPEDARRRGAYGTALIYFELNDDGSVKREKLLRSSGDAALDVESLALVQRAAPFPKPPPGAQKIFAADITFPPPK